MSAIAHPLPMLVLCGGQDKPLVFASPRPPQRKQEWFSEPGQFYMPPAPREEPSLALGRRFYCWESIAGFTTPGGKPANVDRKVLILHEISEDRLTFVAEEDTKTYLLPLTEPLKEIANLPKGLVPVLEDPEVEAMRKKYEGKFLVPFHEGVLQSSGGVSGYFHFRGARLRRLLRLRLPRPLSLSTGAYNFTAYDPLIALYDTPYGLPIIDATSNVSEQELNQAFQQGGIVGIHCFAYYAGAWDMERTISLVSREDVSKKWPTQYRHAVIVAPYDRWTFYNLRKGMTPDMVAWIMGWPPQYGTRDELRKQNRWTYSDDITGDVAIFFKQGRVSAWKASQRPRISEGRSWMLDR